MTVTTSIPGNVASLRLSDSCTVFCTTMELSESPTVGLVLFHNLRVPAWPTVPLAPETSFFVLVYGASTATGTMAIQVLKL